jgi:hypothetical protein
MIYKGYGQKRPWLHLNQGGPALLFPRDRNSFYLGPKVEEDTLGTDFENQ